MSWMPLVALVLLIFGLATTQARSKIRIEILGPVTKYYTKMENDRYRRTPMDESLREEIAAWSRGSQRVTNLTSGERSLLESLLVMAMQRTTVDLAEIPEDIASAEMAYRVARDLVWLRFQGAGFHIRLLSVSEPPSADDAEMSIAKRNMASVQDEP